MSAKQLPLGELITDANVMLRVMANKAKKEKAKPEEEFNFQCRAHKLPAFTTQPMFAKKALGREWRFDFCWQEYMLAVEIEGLVVKRINGQWMVSGRHATITGIKEDMVKYNAAVELGWYVLRFEQSMVKSGEAVNTTMKVLAAKGWKR